MAAELSNPKELNDLLALFGRNTTDGEKRQLIKSLFSIMQKNGLTDSLSTMLPASARIEGYKHPDKGAMLFAVQIIVRCRI